MYDLSMPSQPQKKVAKLTTTSSITYEDESVVSSTRIFEAGYASLTEAGKRLEAIREEFPEFEFSYENVTKDNSYWNLDVDLKQKETINA